IGLKGMAHAIPGLQFEVLIHEVGCGPDRGTAGQQANDAQEQDAPENGPFPQVYNSCVHTPSFGQGLPCLYWFDLISLLGLLCPERRLSLCCETQVHLLSWHLPV